VHAKTKQLIDEGALSQTFLDWCTSASQQYARVDGDSESGRPDPDVCRRFADRNARSFMIYVARIRARSGKGILVEPQATDLFAKLADICMEMQRIGSGRSRSTGWCKTSNEKITDPTYDFSKIDDRYDVALVGTSATPAASDAARIISERFSPGSQADRLTKTLASVGYRCAASPETGRGQCTMSYGILGYDKFVVSGLMGVLWTVEFWNGPDGALTRVQVKTSAGGL